MDTPERITRLVAGLDEASEQSDWEEVRKLAREVLALVPDHVDAGSMLRLADRRLASTARPKEIPLPASFVGGRYQVRRLLGEGRRKKVCLAYDTVLDREVAFGLIKTEGLDPEARERVSREAQLMGRLGSHSSIVSVHDMGQEVDGTPYLILQYIEE